MGRGRDHPQRQRKIQLRWLVAAVAVAAIVAILALPRAIGVDPNRPLAPADTTPDPVVPTLEPTPTTTPDHCTLRIGPDVTLIDQSAGLGPGDTVCLIAGERPSLEIFGVQGAPSDPVTFVNEGGTVEIVGDRKDYAGIDIQSSDHVRVTGTGVSHSCGSSVRTQSCGFVISGSGRGVAATNRASHIEVDHVEIHATSKSGIFMRTSEEQGATRGEWQQEDTKIHHSYVHDTGTEGLYIGSSSYADGRDPVLVGVDIGFNLITDTGWDALQVGSAVETCIVHHNTISRAGLERENNQDSGLIINRGSVCDVADNSVADTAGAGIYIQGNGGNRVYNNLVVGASALGDEPADGIVVSTGSNTDRSVFVWHNTVVGSGRNGISFRNTEGSDNQIANNLIAGWAGVALDVRSDAASWGNVTSRTVDGARLDSRYAPQPGSPAIDAGAPIEFSPLFKDLFGEGRPFGDAADAGAIEYRPGPVS